MRAPDFWQSDGFAAKALSPLGHAYGLLGRLRRRLVTPETAPIPVICIGNLTAGGAGKTPTAIAMAKHLIALGEAPHFVTRGYGGRLRGPVLVEPTRHIAEDVGDEPLLLAALAPTWVSRNRVLGANAAATAGASLVILDDGFQNPYLAYDLALIVVDAAVGFGNNRLIPAGPLRETVANGLSRADAIVLIGEAAGEPLPAFNLPVLQARIRAKAHGLDLSGKRILAFAGIGRPEKFFRTLEELGADLVAKQAFADHHPYAPSEIEALLERARQVDAALITTEKDHARLPITLRNYVKNCR